jgi:hypothetical protein
MRGENGLLNAVRNAPQMVQRLFDLEGIAEIDKDRAGIQVMYRNGVRRGQATNQLGKDGAINLLNWVDDAHVQEMKNANRLALAKTAAKIVLGSGIGGIGYELLK